MGSMTRTMDLLVIVATLLTLGYVRVDAVKWGANDCPGSSDYYDHIEQLIDGHPDIFKNQNLELCQNNPPGEAYNHFRNCYLDIYLSLCAIQQPNDIDWSFICESQNYNLGCRYGYETCYNNKFGDNPEVEVYLTWVDGLTNGGKYAACDMNNLPYYDVVNKTIAKEDCMNNVTMKCIEDIQTYTMNIPDVNDCDLMGTLVNCFFDELDEADCSGTRSILKSYFQGVVSFTPCDNKIPIIAGAHTVIAGITPIVALALIAIFSGFV